MIEHKGMPIFDDMDEEFALKYAPLFKRGMSSEQVGLKMVEDERDELKRAECEVGEWPRNKIQAAVDYGANELGIRPPKVRYFKSAGWKFRGIHYRDWPGEVWVSADLDYREMGRVALHETAHAAHVVDETPRELRERDADRFAARGRYWY